MKKRILAILVTACWLLAAGCHFHGYAHPHGMPPGQAKKVVRPAPGKVWHAAPHK